MFYENNMDIYSYEATRFEAEARLGTYYTFEETLGDRDYGIIITERNYLGDIA